MAILQEIIKIFRLDTRIKITNYTPFWKTDVLCRGNVRPSVRLSVRSQETPLLWLVFGTVGNYVAISDYVADHTKRFQTISWNVSTCHMCLISYEKKTNTHIMDTCVCPSVHVWTETKKHTSYDHLCPSAHVWTVRSYKTPLLWLFFGTVGTFVAILFICSHTKPIATQEKRHPNLWTKVATRHRFMGLDIQTQPHKTQ